MEGSAFTAFLLLLSIYGGNGAARSVSTTLRNKLIEGADKHVRPRDDPTTINMTIVLTSLNELNTVSQELSTTFILRMTWTDKRLAWEPKSDEPDELVFYVDEVWTPPLVITNAIKDAIFLLKNDIVPLRVSHDGTVKWSPRVSPVTTCDIDTSKFPVDHQTCYINISSWVHPTAELDILPIEVKRELSNDLAWEIMGCSPEPQIVPGNNGMEYSNVKITLKFKRRERFHWVLLIVPFGCISALMPLVFLIPPSYSQYKVSYSVTLLLSFTLYLNVLRSLLPPVMDEDNMHILGEFQAKVMEFGSAITMVTIIEVLMYSFVPKEFIVTGTFSGMASGITSALIDVTLEGEFQCKEGENTGKLSMNKPNVNAIKEIPITRENTSATKINRGAATDNPESSFETWVKVYTAKSHRKIVFSDILRKIDSNMYVNGMVSVPGRMDGKFEVKITGNIDKGGEIRNGTITGCLKRCSWSCRGVLAGCCSWSCSEILSKCWSRLGFRLIYHGAVFIAFSTAYAIGAIFFLTNLKAY